MATLTQLEYVLAVEKYRHFGRAAKACYISQPTLSQQIQKLEEEVELVIFDRIQKPIIPTELGKKFLEQAKIVIRENNRLLHFAKKGAQGVSGEFRLGMIPSVSSDLVPLFVESFSKEFPSVELYIEEMKTESVLKELRNDQLDGAILATPLAQPGFKVHPLYYETFALYLSSGHPLMSKKSISAEDLEGDQMWMLSDGHCFKNQILNFCSLSPEETMSAVKNIHFQSGSLSTLRNLVRNSRGYTLLPFLLVQQLPAVEEREHIKWFKPPVPTREISFVYRRDHWKLEMIDALEKTISKSLPQGVSRQKLPNQMILDIALSSSGVS